MLALLVLAAVVEEEEEEEEEEAFASSSRVRRPFNIDTFLSYTDMHKFSRSILLNGQRSATLQGISSTMSGYAALAALTPPWSVRSEASGKR